MMIKWDNVALTVSVCLMITVVLISFGINNKVIDLGSMSWTDKEKFAIFILPVLLWTRVEYINYKNNKKDN